MYKRIQAVMPYQRIKTHNPTSYEQPATLPDAVVTLRERKPKNNRQKVKIRRLDFKDGEENNRALGECY
jgi:hypothetical protein